MTTRKTSPRRERGESTDRTELDPAGPPARSPSPPPGGGLEGWGIDAERHLDILGTLSADEAVGRVITVERGRYLVATARETRWSSLSGREQWRAASETAPAVGDWVVVRGPRTDRVLPRRTVLARRAPGGRSQAQIIASNLDRVFIVTAVGADFSARRLQRYISLVHRSGAAPVVVLNKTDLPYDVVETMRALDTAAPGVPLCMVSGQSGDVAALLPHLRPGETVALVGSSGVGKSTLLNRLLGQARQATATVRAHDETGRHTTTRRQLVRVPSGALLIDTPGLREVGLVGDVDAVDATFDDVAGWAEGCRFADCRHSNEPGCAVRAALERGDLSAERWASHEQLRREAAAEARRSDARLRQNTKARWKAIHKGMRARSKIDPKLKR